MYLHSSCLRPGKPTCANFSSASARRCFNPSTESSYLWLLVLTESVHVSIALVAICPLCPAPGLGVIRLKPGVALFFKFQC